MRGGRSRVFYFALAAVVVFFVAGTGLVGFSIAGLRRRVPVTLTGDYDMPVAQVQQFVKAAAVRLHWKSTGDEPDGKDEIAYFFSAPDPNSPLPRVASVTVNVGPSQRKGDAATVRILGLARTVKPLKALLDEQLPAVEPAAKPSP